MMKRGRENKGKKLCALAISALILGTAFALPAMPAVSGAFNLNAYAAESSVTVAVPAFPVILNGQEMNREYGQYPPIVYKDITYFPMTYYDCRFLGIETRWTQQEGLSIDATGVTGAYTPYRSSVKNKIGTNAYKATIARDSIKVNGVKVDNSKEKYPLLVFRDITYFPMTWKWGAEIFGWDYKFDNAAGLRINSVNKMVMQSGKLKGAAVPDSENSYSTAAIICDGKVYYNNEKGQIIQANANDLSEARAVYQLEKNSYSSEGNYVNPEFFLLDGKAVLGFHLGGAIMGSDWRVALNQDGTTEVLQNSYVREQRIGDTVFSYNYGHGGYTNNIDMKPVSGGDGQKAGEDRYRYEPLSDLSPMFRLAGRDLYVKALDDSVTDDAKRKYYISEINLDTHKTTVIASRPADSDIYVGDDFIYYTNGNSCFKIDLNSGTETLIGTAAGEPGSMKLFVCSGEVYGIAKDGTVSRFRDGKSFGRNVASLKCAGENENYIIGTFAESSDRRYSFVVCDSKGAVLFKTADRAASITVEDGTVCYYNTGLQTICRAKLV